MMTNANLGTSRRPAKPPSFEALSDAETIKEVVAELCAAAGPGSEVSCTTMVKQLAAITDNLSGLMVPLPRAKMPELIADGLGPLRVSYGVPRAATYIIHTTGVHGGGLHWPEAHTALAVTWVLMGAEHTYQCACCLAAMDCRANAFDSTRIMLKRTPCSLEQFTPMMYALVDQERRRLLERLVENYWFPSAISRGDRER